MRFLQNRVQSAVLKKERDKIVVTFFLERIHFKLGGRGTCRRVPLPKVEGIWQNFRRGRDAGHPQWEKTEND